MKKSIITLIVLGFVSACGTYTHTTIIDSRGSHLKGVEKMTRENKSQRSS